MKVIKFKITLLICMAFKLVSGQITLDYIDTNNTYRINSTFYPVDIDNDETKYVFLDITNNQFDLYNMNFTPFMSDIQLPGSFDPNFRVMYISRQLFDCDSTNIEYIYSAPNEPTAPFRIIRTDGTVLFSRDSTFGIYCIGCLGGSNDIRPIRKTSAGTKMFLGKFTPSNLNNGIQTQVYSICGSLPVGYTEIFNPLVSSAKVYPNPSSNEVVFEINLPNNIYKYDLTIYDQNGKEILKERDLKSNKQSIPIANFSAGIYFYSLTSDDKPFATGKIVTTK